MLVRSESTKLISSTIALVSYMSYLSCATLSTISRGFFPDIIIYTPVYLNTIIYTNFHSV